MAKFGAGILKYHGKIWYKFPDCGTRKSIDREWWLLFPAGLWLVAVNCSRILDGCSYFLELLGTMEMCIPREIKTTPRKESSDLTI